MSRFPATDAALSTTELLEQILSHLDIKDLVVLRRVSRHWRDVMPKSLVIQRAMFLAPEPKLPFQWHLQWITLGQPWRYIKKPFGAVSEPPEPPESVLQSSRFNPLLFVRRPDIESRGVRNGRVYSPVHAQ